MFYSVFSITLQFTMALEYLTFPLTTAIKASMLRTCWKLDEKM